MQRHINISRAIACDWTEESVSKIKAYWVGRGFRFLDESSSNLRAKRGCVLWNLVTYNMARLATVLTIHHEDPSQIHMTMKICTMWQILTGWNRSFFELEMETCESFLRSSDLRESEWKVFTKEHRKANLLWTLTLGICGNSPPSSSKP